MDMTLKYKLIATAATLVVALVIGNAVRSHFHMKTLERAVEQTKQSADTQKLRSDELEKQTYIYKEKTAYLERRLAEVQTAAKQHDETLEKLSTDTDTARRDLQRFRRGSR
jgi:predicted negative regulator of RcsB-dependent stress response